MFDQRIRRVIVPGLDLAGRRLARAGVTPGALTASGWAAGVGACVAAAARAWPLALGLWLLNRAVDGLDGAVARALGPTALGGFLDVVADFSVYGGFVVGVAIGVPGARLACAVLLLAYYVSGTALLSASTLADRRAAPAPAATERGGAADDGRSLRLTGGLAEGAETIVVYVLFCLLPGSAAGIAWGFAAAVGFTALQRVAAGARLLAERGRR